MAESTTPQRTRLLVTLAILLALFVVLLTTAAVMQISKHAQRSAPTASSASATHSTVSSTSSAGSATVTSTVTQASGTSTSATSTSSTAADSAVPSEAKFVADIDGSKVFTTGPTSDEFAHEVHKSYTDNPRTTLDVFSPATGQTYMMTCTETGAVVECSGGDNARVYLEK